MRRWRATVRRLLPFLALALASLLVAAAGPRALAALAYARWSVRSGEVWRLLTTHLVHAGASHLAWNLGGLAMVALLVGRQLSAARWSMVALGGACGTSLGVFLLSPRTTAMAGLSGLLHALLAAGAVAALRRDRQSGGVLLVALAGQLVAERWELWPAASSLGRATAIDAHLCGALAGALLGALLAMTRENQERAAGSGEQQ
jgi:rhomboid family GlyGly-CTERM serine protease